MADKDEKYQYPYSLKGMSQANTCPYCGSQGGVSLENLEFDINSEHTELTMTSGFECMYCADSWWQEITVKLGEVTKNEVTLSE